MKDYYTILGLPRTATAREVRVAYRKLVQRYHPDVNPDPSTHELIKEINEAYEVLGDIDKRRGYDFILDNPYSVATEEVEQPKPHRDPRYRRRSPYPPQPPKVSAQVILMKSLLPYLTKVAWAGCILCSTLLLDFIWPRQISEAKVRIHYSLAGSYVALVTKDGEIMDLGGDYLDRVYDGEYGTIERSGLFSILLGLRVIESHIYETNIGSLYRNFLFIPLLLALLSVLSIKVKGSIESQFSIGLVNSIIFITTLLMLLA